MDQIHDYAIYQHRPFVMNHLEAWHARHQKTLEPIKIAFSEIHAATAPMDMFTKDADTSDSDSDNINSGSDDSDFEELAREWGLIFDKPAEWLRLKELSRIARQDAANETRQRNRRLKIAEAQKVTEHTGTTRPRGRPRMSGIAKVAPKRGRGRPRKYEAIIKEAPKRGRGRPPKTTIKRV